MSVTTGDILRVACRQTYDGTEDVINVFHFGVANPPTPNTDAALLADISLFMSVAYDQLESFLSSALEATDITVYNVTDDRPHGVTAWGGGYDGGNAVGEGLPVPDCLLVLYPTSVKRTVGRTYLSPFTESSQAGGRWNSTVRAAVEGFVNALTDTGAGPAGLELQFGVYKRSTGLLYEISSFRTQEVVAYQRRRKPGRGS